MAVMKKYPPDLKERAVRLVLEARKSPDRRGASARVAQQLGVKEQGLFKVARGVMGLGRGGVAAWPLLIEENSC